ncbi:MAG: 4a-hydroxytetrahydrobiopterin dehydratase [Paracoccaceae bacterium]|nr:4a-hydroxytetrahydrobiopterin dehydratase [Paracoccaceae bacterium]MDE2673772.1 4a-hydroxytetrahydrobiopterin dehydratase [Paracoccaceae bacterium]
MVELLTEDERNIMLAELEQSGWTYIDEKDSLAKSFKFKNFIQALGWLVEVGLISEKLNHHPEIHNVYNRVILILTTHSAKGLTNLDIRLAKRIDKLRASPDQTGD